MRFLAVDVDWPPPTFLRRLFEGLAARAGFEVWIATHARVGAPLRRLALPPRRWPRPLRDALLAPAVLAGASRDPGRARRLASAGAWRDLALLRRRFDVVYFPWNASAVAHLPLLRELAAHGGPASIVSCRGSQISVAPHDPVRRDLVEGLPDSFAAATAVHAVSEAIAVEAERFGLDPAKVRVIRPAVDLDAFAPVDPASAPPEPPPLRLVAVGALGWVKGFEDAVEAVGRLRDAGVDVRFDLVGDGPERQRVLFTVHDLGLQDRVTLHGRQPPETVARILRSSHVYLLSSVSEGIANAVLEAMASGLAVVSTRVGGMAEAIDDAVEGLLVPPRDPGALADAVARLAADPELRRRLGRAARRRVERDFRLDAQVDAFAALCRDVAR